MSGFFRFWKVIYRWLDYYIAPIYWLILRVAMAFIFWRSGSVSLHNMDATIYLFEHEYNIDFIPPIFAAYLSTLVEVVASILLAVGFLGRWAALCLCSVTLIIQTYYMALDIHIFWALILAFFIFSGPGKISIDYFLQRRFFS